jgi:hypothetical protein
MTISINSDKMVFANKISITTSVSTKTYEKGINKVHGIYIDTDGRIIKIELGNDEWQYEVIPFEEIEFFKYNGEDFFIQK